MIVGIFAGILAVASFIGGFTSTDRRNAEAQATKDAPRRYMGDDIEPTRHQDGYRDERQERHDASKARVRFQ